MNLGLPEYIRTLAPYVPGKPIDETKREFGLKKVIKLASNENPIGPSPKAILACRKFLKELHRYPDSNAYDLKRALSKFLNLTPQEITVGNGSNELMDLILRTFSVPGDAVVASRGAFIAFRICAQILGLQVIETPLLSDLRFDLDAMAKAVEDHPRVKSVYVPNPNNPTGTYVNRLELEKFIARVGAVRGGSVSIILDYAYWEFVTAPDLPDALELRKMRPKQIFVLRTFSKVYGLAGLRIGYAIGHAETIAQVEKVRQPFNFNSMALAAATAALADKAFVRRGQALAVRAKRAWIQFFEREGIPFSATQGNFILIDTRKVFGMSGVELFHECLKFGVIFRPVANYGLGDYLRISFGLEAENRLAMATLKKVRAARG